MLTNAIDKATVQDLSDELHGAEVSLTRANTRVMLTSAIDKATAQDFEAALRSGRAAGLTSGELKDGEVSLAKACARSMLKEAIQSNRARFGNSS